MQKFKYLWRILTEYGIFSSEIWIFIRSNKRCILKSKQNPEKVSLGINMLRFYIISLMLYLYICMVVNTKQYPQLKRKLRPTEMCYCWRILKIPWTSTEGACKQKNDMSLWSAIFLLISWRYAVHEKERFLIPEQTPCVFSNHVVLLNLYRDSSSLQTANINDPLLIMLKGKTDGSLYRLRKRDTASTLQD